MEFHQLLENEKFKAAIGPEKIAIYLGEGGEELFSEEYSEALNDESIIVLQISEQADHDPLILDIHYWNGVYISCNSISWESLTTLTIDDHVKKLLNNDECNEWRPEDTELKSDKLSLEELKAIGLIFLSVESSTAEDGWVALPATGQLFSSQITINGKTYERHNGELVEVSE
jgi:hypothetical protein